MRVAAPNTCCQDEADLHVGISESNGYRAARAFCATCGAANEAGEVADDPVVVRWECPTCQHPIEWDTTP